MFKVSELNPKDTVLDRIHAIQRKINKKLKGLSEEQQLSYYKEVRKKLEKEYKIKFKVVSSNSKLSV